MGSSTAGELHACKSIKLFQYALSDKEGYATFYPGRKSGWGSLFPSPHATASDKKPITVKTRKLDNVLKEEGIKTVDIVKIDVEGADLLVLKGAEQTLKKTENIHLLMDVDVKTAKEKNQLLKFLELCGFRILRIGRKLTALREIDERTKDIYATKQDNFLLGNNGEDSL